MDPWHTLGILLLAFVVLCIALGIVIVGALLRYVVHLILRSYRQR